MDNFILEGSKTTPEINFNINTGILKISGESYPENALEFYKPIFDFLRAYLETKPKNLEFHFKMIYFNTSSSKAILDMLDILENSYKLNGNCKVFWHYQEDDEDIQESGEEFAEGLQIPYDLVSYK